MNKLKSFIIDSAIFFIILLIILSIAGAFLGAQRAQKLFNSFPLKIFWILWIVSLVAGFLAFRRLRKKIDLFLIHIGIVLIITGSIWSSQTGHKIWEKISGTKKISQAGMVIFEGAKENRVVIQASEEIAELPFYLKLNDFRIVYYKPGHINIITDDKHFYRIPAVVGNGVFINKKTGSLRITRVFGNFKIRFKDGHPIVVDSSGKGENPAVEIEHVKPDGQIATYYIFERFPEFSKIPKYLKITYHRQIKDFISDVEVIKAGRVILSKSIRVNHPLHFGGYHFYQQSYDEKEGRYTVLLVVSDLGLEIVWLGYVLLGAGIVWLFYIKDIVHILNKRRNGNQI